ncbi:MAG: hypothetical protein ACQESP_12925, partial [Candidatus Muiribacteriota bacterium]
FSYSCSLLDIKEFDLKTGADKWKNELKNFVSESTLAEYDFVKPGYLCGAFGKDKKSPLTCFFTADKGSVQKSDINGVYPVCLLNRDYKLFEDTEFERVWCGFLKFYNLFQFLPNSVFYLTGKDFEIDCFSEYSFSDFADNKGSEEWAEIIEMTDSTCSDLIKSVELNNGPVPEVGYELEDDKGKIVCEAELAWPEIKKAVLLKDNKEFLSDFKDLGWSVFFIDDLNSDIEKFIQDLKHG